jgi:hypothetical protein
MITDPFQRKAYDAVSAALPFAIDPAKITVEPGVSYLPSPIKLHDYAAGVMAAFGSVVENLGRVRGLPAQTMTLNRRLAALAEREERGGAWRVDASLTRTSMFGNELVGFGRRETLCAGHRAGPDRARRRPGQPVGHLQPHAVDVAASARLAGH